jgi:hypothetical protein
MSIVRDGNWFLLTVVLSDEKYALSTASLWPVKVFGRNPSTGSNVKRRAVMSREVVMKHLEKIVSNLVSHIR